jgi:hypothetical protein
MSRHGEVKFPWGDGEHAFRLGIGEIRQLQEVCDAGPPVIAQRLRNGLWRVDDIRETLRLGLIGAGLTQDRALGKIMRFVDNRPLQENALSAWIVLNAAIIGAEDEPVGKASEDATKAAPSPMERSPSPISTQPAAG